MHAFLYSTLCENYCIEYQYFSLYLIKVRPTLWQDYAEVLSIFIKCFSSGGSVV